MYAPQLAAQEYDSPDTSLFGLVLCVRISIVIAKSMPAWNHLPIDFNRKITVVTERNW